MRTRGTELAELVEAGAQQIVGALRAACDEPEWSQCDHAWPWAQGGRTDIENMRSVCGVHNRRLTQGWRLERLPNRQYAVHPPKAPDQPAIRRLSALGAGTRF